MARTWRLLVDDAPASGAWNMAADGALLASRAAGGPPTLRVYRWVRPTASLGRFQPAADADAAACDRHGVDVVRRATGGRGVLHDDEVTYSVVAAEEDGVPRGVAASYAHLGAGLIEAYRRLGIPAQLTSAHRGRRGSAACYLAASMADITAAGAKLSGSAQVWRAGVCLQHGSFVITRDAGRESGVFALDGEAAAALVAETVTLRDLLGRSPDAAEVTAAIAAGFASALGIELVVGALTVQEAGRARADEGSCRIRDAIA